MRRSVILFAKWLRAEYEFPVRLPVYLFPSERIITQHGDVVSASFFAPWDPAVEPFIRLATGDYSSMRRELGRDNALASILGSLAHEVVHYHQWIATGETTERGVVACARKIVERYALTTDHP